MLQKCSLIRVASIFFNEPTKEHYLLGISRDIGLAHTSTKRYLDELKKKGIIKQRIEKKGKRMFPVYIANLDNSDFRKYKKIYNLYLIESSGLADFIKGEVMPKSLVLFGSFARGEDIESSDIDIFVESKKKDLDISHFENMLNRKLQLHFKEHLKDYPRELKNNIANGIVLGGYLEAF